MDLRLRKDQKWRINHANVGCCGANDESFSSDISSRLNELMMVVVVVLVGGSHLRKAFSGCLNSVKFD